MFVQVIRGESADSDALRRQFQTWSQELRPGAAGFMTATEGVTDDGRFVGLVCFESAEAARANSERPEQGEWWQETARALRGEPVFVDCDEADTLLAGPSAEAGFVQVMQGGPADRSRLNELDASFEAVAREHRPDVIGGLRAWHPDGRFTQAVYFTREAEARTGESQQPPPDVEPVMAEQREAWGDVEWLDLRDPWVLV
ncbi:MAG TPA: hypothetical protein VFZ68_13870 [Acidimicrobiales bacterium]